MPGSKVAADIGAGKGLSMKGNPNMPKQTAATSVKGAQSGQGKAAGSAVRHPGEGKKK